jgi:myosin heavy subunit
MVELAKGYEQEFIKNLAMVNKKIAGYESSLNQESALTDIKHGINQADNCLKNMEKEILNLTPQQANLFAPRVKRHTEALATSRKSLREIDFKRSKTDLMGSKREDSRDKLLTGNEILQNSGEALDRINKLAKDTEDIGYQSMDNLKRQRLTIQGINDKTNDVAHNVAFSGRTITEMNSRRLWMKCMMYGIIFLLIAAICILLYIKLL